jgi:hypothetical protein
MGNNRKSRFVNKNLKELNIIQKNYIEDLTNSLLIIQNSEPPKSEKKEKEKNKKETQ